MKHLILFIFIFSAMCGISYSQTSVNYAASFGGNYSYASLGNGTDFTTSFTLEAWVNPKRIGPGTMAVFGKNYQTGFFLGIQASGRIVFYPRGNNSLRSRVNGTVPAGVWTHIAATYNGAQTCIYINGVLDTSTFAISGLPTPNNDSLYLGADIVGVFNLFYYGLMDNVRIWNRARTAAEIKENRFIPFNFYDPSGAYFNLRRSIQFNNDINNYLGINLNLVDFSGKAVNISDYNNNLVLNGTTDYCSHENNNHWFDMPGSFTLELWAKRDTTGSQPAYLNMLNKSGGTNSMDYGLYASSSGDVFFAINNFSYILQAPGILQTSQWTHLAASYDRSDGKAVIYCNGDSASGTYFSGNPDVQNNPFLFFIGTSGASNTQANKFKGQLDDIKIWFKAARTAKEIKDNMFTNRILKMNSADSVVYITFDRYSDGVHFGGSSHVGGLKYVANAHINSSHALINNSSSPVISDPLNEFNASSFSMSYRKFFVPDGNIDGISDSIYISEGAPVSSLNVCIMMSHPYVSDIDVILTSPSGASVYLLENNGGNANDVYTIFSDMADSTASLLNNVNGPGINPPFSPSIKPNQNLSYFNGQNRKGWWKLTIYDNAGPDIGYVHGWGLNLRPQKALKLSAYIQGFYNSITDLMIPDFAKAYLRRSSAPYSLVDSAFAKLDSNGRAGFYFNNAQNSTGYYLILTHRNSLDTWSKTVLSFSSDTLQYDFTSAANSAYGNNQIRINSSPVKFGVYGGDVTRDGIADLSDLTLVYNDAKDFVSGYPVTDLTGDNVVNLSDLILINNNAKDFVAVRRP